MPPDPDPPEAPASDNKEIQALQALVGAQRATIEDQRKRIQQLEEDLRSSAKIHLKTTGELQKQVRDLLDLIEYLKKPEEEGGAHLKLIRKYFDHFQDALEKRDAKIHVLQKQGEKSYNIHLASTLRMKKEIAALREQLDRIQAGAAEGDAHCPE